VHASDHDRDDERALAACAEIARARLGDFSPALVLLPALDRQRVQTLLAWSCSLFDLARVARPGEPEGERLAAIKRRELALESALAGKPEDEPVLARMAREQRRRSWPAEALAEIAACARRRATRPRPATPEEAEADAERLVRAAVTALLGAPPPDEVSAFAGALLRLRRLQELGAEIAAGRNPLALSEMEETGGPPEAVRLVRAARQDCRRLRPRLLRAPRGLIDLPAGHRRAAVFCLHAGLRLLARIEDAEDGDERLLANPPRLGLAARLGLVARARWSRIG
jgi:hypothetical protein